MARQALLSLGTRFGAGHGLWSIVAFLFPMLAVVKDDSVGMAMLLFLLETLMASALLVVRLSASRRAARDDHEARRRLGEAIRMVQFFVLPFSLGCAMLLGVVTFIEVAEGARRLRRGPASRPREMDGALPARERGPRLGDCPDPLGHVARVGRVLAGEPHGGHDPGRRARMAGDAVHRHDPVVLLDLLRVAAAQRSRQPQAGRARTDSRADVRAAVRARHGGRHRAAAVLPGHARHDVKDSQRPLP